MPKRSKDALFVATVLSFSIESSALAENWPQWRGPRADGVSQDESFPIRWSRQSNLIWKTPLPGRGASSPIVWNDRIFITGQIGEGPMETRLPRDRGNVAAWEDPSRRSEEVILLVQAFRRSDGHLLWEYRIPAGKPLPSVYPTHNLASPSVVTDGNAVFAWFGTGQLVALDPEGKLLWQRHLGEEYFPFRVTRGHASSPVLDRDSLFLLVDHVEAAMLLCLDKSTGKELFKVDRGKGRRSYSTPLLVTGERGDELIVNSSERIDAYDPRNGSLLWHAGEPVPLSIPMPVFHRGILYVSRGYTSSPYLAVPIGGRGEVLPLWHVRHRAPYVSSLLFYQELLYMATERGIASAIDPKTGELVWRERLGGVFTASPVAAEGRVYLLNESGETVVLAAGPEPRELARNSLEERCLASLALSGGQIFIRCDQHLFAIGR